nr:catalase-related domain-containing protein [Shimwellia pseudoproteus]
MSGTTQQQIIAKTDNFEQAGVYYLSLTPQQQDDLIEALGGELKKVKNPTVRQAMLSHFYKANATYGTRLANWTKDDVKTIQALADKLKD